MPKRALMEMQASLYRLDFKEFSLLLQKKSALIEVIFLRSSWLKISSVRFVYVTSKSYEVEQDFIAVRTFLNHSNI